MKQPKISPDNKSEINLNATLVFERGNSIVCSRPLIMSTVPNTRDTQEQLFMEMKDVNSTTQYIKETQEQFFTATNDLEKKDNLPKSCFKVFAAGVVNNLNEMAKCLRLNR